MTFNRAQYPRGKAILAVGTSDEGRTLVAFAGYSRKRDQATFSGTTYAYNGLPAILKRRLATEGGKWAKALRTFPAERINERQRLA